MTKEEYQEWVMSELVGQLAASERFQQFVSMNYDIKQIVDDESKEVRLQVMEVPYQVAQERIKAQVAEKLDKDASGIQVVGADALDKLAES